MQNKIWFKAKKYGWGWYPCTWQGWAVLAMYVFALVTSYVYINNHEFSDSDFLIQFFPQTYILTVFLIIICYATGEKLYWRWGNKVCRNTTGAADDEQELIDVVDRDGLPVGVKVSRADIHTKGLWHRTAQVYVVNSKNEVLLQRRAKGKISYPNMWHLSAGGHIETGSGSLETAQKETFEEIGLKVPLFDFNYIGTVISSYVFNGGAYRDNEFNDVFLVFRDIDSRELIKQEDEVCDVQWFPLEEFEKKLKKGDREFVPSSSAEHVFTHLRHTHAHGTR